MSTNWFSPASGTAPAAGRVSLSSGWFAPECAPEFELEFRPGPAPNPVPGDVLDDIFGDTFDEAFDEAFDETRLDSGAPRSNALDSKRESLPESSIDRCAHPPMNSATMPTAAIAAWRSRHGLAIDRPDQFRGPDTISSSFSINQLRENESPSCTPPDHALSSAVFTRMSRSQVVLKLRTMSA